MVQDKKRSRGVRFLIDHAWIPPLVFVCVAMLTAADIAQDLSLGTTKLHIATELLLLLFVGVFAMFFWTRLVISVKNERALRKDLRAARNRNDRWRERQRGLLEQLSHAIAGQFDAWGFSPSEKEVAFLLLKGLSMKEVAGLRGSTPHSIRQQAHVLYHKAGLAGRAELSAFFLSGLLPPSLERAD
ncbi:MAG: helix-turn-helix transcriptional regulator [Pseudohongiellaceae bacterium]|jgi:DNA-binding CsgD family transcriptional regulator